jgi:hypothetical protein
MIFRRGTVVDAGPIAALIASFQSELTVDLRELVQSSFLPPSPKK